MSRLTTSIRLATSAALLGAAATAGAADFGALVTNDSTFTGNKVSELTLDQMNAASAWLRIPFNNAGSAYFTAEGLYQVERTPIAITADKDDVGDAENESAIDVDLVKLAASFGAGSGTVTLAGGRFSTADVSGVIYNQNADGAFVGYESPTLTASLYGAYTGLLNTRTVTMLDDVTEEDTEKLYQLSTKYAVATATVSLPNLVANQTITAQFLGTFRLEDDSYNRLYAALALNGPLARQLFYTASSTLGIRMYDGDTELSNLSKASLTLYTGVKGLTFAANGVYASGEQGPFKAFEGFTSQTAVKAYSGRTEYTGVVKGGLSASVKPVENVLAVFSGDAIFDAQDSSASYEGFQWQANLNWQVVSDVSLCATMYQYYDNDDSDRNKTGMNLYAAISF